MEEIEYTVIAVTRRGGIQKIPVKTAHGTWHAASLACTQYTHTDGVLSLTVVLATAEPSGDGQGEGE